MAAANVCMPFRPAFENSQAIPGALAVITLSGTTTLVNVYSNAGLSVAADNPIVANSVGRFPQRFVSDSVALRMRVFDAGADIDNDTPIEDFDPWTPTEAGAAATNPNFSVATGAAGTNVVLSGSYPNLLLTIPQGSPGATTGASWGSITGTLSSQSDLNTALAAKAALASPTFTGTPAAPTASGSTSTTQIATTAMVQAALAQNLVHSLYVPASAMIARTTNGAAAGSSETTTNKVMLSTLDYDQSTIEYAQFSIAMPKSWDESTVTFAPIWTASSGTGDVVWGLQGVALSNDDATDTAFGTAQTSTDTLITTGDVHVGPTSSAITVAGSPAAEDWVVFQVLRNASSGSDTLNADAKLLGVRLYLTTNAKDDS